MGKTGTALALTWATTSKWGCFSRGTRLSPLPCGRFPGLMRSPQGVTAAVPSPCKPTDAQFPNHTQQEWRRSLGHFGGQPQALSHTGHPNWPSHHGWVWGTVWEQGSSVLGPRAPRAPSRPCGHLETVPVEKRGPEAMRFGGACRSTPAPCASPLGSGPWAPPCLRGLAFGAASLGITEVLWGLKINLVTLMPLRRPFSVVPETSYRFGTVSEKLLTLVMLPLWETGHNVTKTHRAASPGSLSPERSGRVMLETPGPCSWCWSPMLLSITPLSGPRGWAEPPH